MTGSIAVLCKLLDNKKTSSWRSITLQGIPHTKFAQCVVTHHTCWSLCDCSSHKRWHRHVQPCSSDTVKRKSGAATRWQGPKSSAPLPCRVAVATTAWHLRDVYLPPNYGLPRGIIVRKLILLIKKRKTTPNPKLACAWGRHVGLRLNAPWG